MELEFILLLFFILFFASLVHGSIGFGFPMIATPLLALFLDIQSAIIYTLIPTLLVNIISIKSEGSILQAIKKFRLLVFYTGLGSILGTVLLIYFNSSFFKLLLAFSILSYLFLDMVKIRLPWIKDNPNKAKVVFGLFAGLLGGLTNAMAPALIIYTLESNFTKKEIIQASNICFFFGKIIQIILFSFSSAFALHEVSISFISLTFVVLALFIGVKIKTFINPSIYKKIVKLILFSIAIILIVKYFLF